MPITGTPNCIEGRDKVVFTWDGADICWGANPYCWDEVYFLVHLGRRANLTGADQFDCVAYGFSREKE